MALTSITVNSGSTIAGRTLARNGAVTLDDNVFTSTECVIREDASPPVTTPPVTAPPVTTPPVTPTTASPSQSDSPGPTITESDNATESVPATESESATESELITESDNATEDTSTDSSGTLADTGSSGLTSIAAVGGALVVLLGVTLLAVARTRARPKRRH